MRYITPYISYILFLIALLIAAVFHGYNMFSFPYFESDEGTYISQAWAIVEFGALSPYTYWYDHPPGGWIFIALWTLLFSDGFFAFGSSIETGRVFMLFLHVISAAFIFEIVRYFTGRALPAFAASFLFSISPLAIYFQRRVLIDNIMIFWFLAAIAILCFSYKNVRLRHYIFSGIFFGFAVLTKMTAVFFGPAILFFLWMHRSPVPQYFRVTIWMMVSGMIVSLFFLFAILSNEFFAPTDPENGHVSFLGAVQFQAGRDGGRFLSADSAFVSAVQDWFDKDPFFTVIAFIILASGFLTIPFFRNVRFFLLSMVPYGLFLVSGSVNFNFYILPLIPIVVMAWTIYLHNLFSFLSRRAYIFFFVLVIFATGYYYWHYGERDHFVRDETRNQKDGVVWIKQNLPNDAAILIDNLAYVDLHDPRYINEKTFPNADWYYKISRDPEVGVEKYNLDWRNFDYVNLTHEMLKQIKAGSDPIIRTTFDNAYPYKKWLRDPYAFLDLPKMISTNGDWTILYAVGDKPYENLLSGWKAYREKTLANYGQIIDPATGVTTSQGQAHALLQSVMMNDEDVFKGIWLWTQDHLQTRTQDGLFSGAWKDDRVLEGDSDVRADADIAVALFLAAHAWDESDYRDSALEIVDELWEYTVVDIVGRYYHLPVNKISAERYEDKYILSPSHFSPAWYRIFAQFDPDHPWEQLATDTYLTLNDLSDVQWNVTGLPQTHAIIDIATGTFSSADKYVEPRGYADRFSQEASQTLWRISLDEQWFEREAATNYLAKMRTILETYYDDTQFFPMGISRYGVADDETRSYVFEAGYLGMLMSDVDHTHSEKYYLSTFAGAYNQDYSPFGVDQYSLEERWAWLGYAHYHGVFRNLLEHDYIGDSFFR